MFERDPVIPTSFSERPRQCFPVAVIMYNRVGSLTDAVDLRLMAVDHPRSNKTANRGNHSDVSVMVGQAGRRQVVISNAEKAPKSSVDVSAASTASENQLTSHRTVLSGPAGMITKITISNDRETSDAASTTENHGCRPPASQLSNSAATASMSSRADIKPTALLPSTQLAAAATESPAGNTRSQYSHLIRRRKKTQATSVSPRDRTPAVRHTVADLPSPPLPTVNDTPSTLLQHQKSLVSDITKQLSVELSSVTSFLRVTKPAHIDDRERVALQSMQLINAAYQRLTPVCLKYRQFCANVAENALPDVDVLRVHDSTLRRCRDKLKASFTERRDVILQTPIAGEQRLFTFVWLQRHSTTIIDCINVVVEVLEAILLPPPSSVQTSDNQSATSNAVEHLETNGCQEVVLDADDVKPNISLLDVECVRAGGGRLGLDELGEYARPPSLIPAIKTDIVATDDEPPVLQPCNFPQLKGAFDNSRSLCSPQGINSQEDYRCSATQQVNSLTPDRSTVPVMQRLAIKEEQQEDILTSQSTLSDTVLTDASETLDRSQLADHIARNRIISGQMRFTMQYSNVLLTAIVITVVMHQHKETIHITLFQRNLLFAYV